MIKLKTSNCHSSSQQLEDIAESDSSESEREESSSEELDDGDENECVQDDVMAHKKRGSVVMAPRISNGITGSKIIGLPE